MSEETGKAKKLLAAALSLAGVTAGVEMLRRKIYKLTIRRLALTQRLLDDRTPAGAGLSFEEVSFKSRDGLNLHGWYIPSTLNISGKATIIMGHGHGGSKFTDLHYAAFFCKGGYNVFMLDFRGHGRSEGPLGTSMGYWERFDIAGAVDWLLGRGLDRIGIFGISMGASIAILAGAENPHIRAVVADSPYAHLRRSIAAEVNNISHLPLWLVRPLGYLGYTILARHHSFSWMEGNPAQVVGQIAPRPLLIIHAEKDRLTRVENAYILFKLAGEPKELWIQPDIGHVEGYGKLGTEYERRVLKFLNRVDWESEIEVIPPPQTLDGQPIPRSITS